MGNNPKDRHVLAAAVRGNAEVIVTAEEDIRGHGRAGRESDVTLFQAGAVGDNNTQVLSGLTEGQAVQLPQQPAKPGHSPFPGLLPPAPG